MTCTVRGVGAQGRVHAVQTLLDSLPDDIDALKRLVLERDEKLEASHGDLLVQSDG